MKVTPESLKSGEVHSAGSVSIAYEGGEYIVSTPHETRTFRRFADALRFYRGCACDNGGGVL